MTGELHLRCASPGVPCEHVVALVAAGHQALYVTGCPEQGKALLEHAQQLAAAHNYGQPSEFLEAS